LKEVIFPEEKCSIIPNAVDLKFKHGDAKTARIKAIGSSYCELPLAFRGEAPSPQFGCFASFSGRTKRLKLEGKR
jgi:hypothetical protein